MISVVIPLFNKESVIYTSISSVLRQSFQDFEIIVVDDGSTDKSVDVVQSYNDERIRIVQQTNQGVSAARNRGIEEAQGEYITFLDADDEWDKDYLLVQSQMIEKYPQCDVFATNYHYQHNNRKLSLPIINKLPFDTTDGILTNYFEVASCSSPPICSISIVVRKTVIQSIGGFPIGITSGEDLLTWAKLAAKFLIAYNKRALAIYHIGNQSFKSKPTRIPQEPDKVGKELELLYQNNRNLIGVRHYVALWYKMRASIYLRLGNKHKGRKNVVKALQYNPINYKLYAYFIISFFPPRFLFK